MAKKKLNILPFVDIFDTALAKPDRREFKARNYIYASEIGMSFHDRYLSMTGIAPSNLPNSIAIRKFKLGSMIEDFFKIVLYEIGLLHAQEKRVMSNFDFGLKVSGRLDVLYGGNFNIVSIESVVSKLSFLSFIGVLSEAIHEFALQNSKVKYDICGLEIKSVSDLVFNRIESRGKPEPHHALQAYHYAYWEDMPFQIVYFDKNNGRIQSFWIHKEDQELYNLYVNDIMAMTKYYESGKCPSPDPLIKMDNGKFSSNWHVQYSKYLTHTYGFVSKQDYSDYVLPLVTRWNRVLIRMNDGKELTPDNIKAIHEMRKMGFEIEWTNETVDIPHEEVKNEPKKKESTEDKMNKLKGLMS